MDHGRYSSPGEQARPSSARLGAASSSATLQAEPEESTPEQMAAVRDAAHNLRPSLFLEFNKVLDGIGSCGLTFKRPGPDDQNAPPAAAAIPSKAPPEEILKYMQYCRGL